MLVFRMYLWLSQLDACLLDGVAKHKNSLKHNVVAFPLLEVYDRASSWST